MGSGRESGISGLTVVKILPKLYVIGFLKGLYFHLPIFTIFLVGHGVNLEAIVFAASFYSLLQFLMEVPTGLIADRFGQRVSMIIGYLLEALGLVVVILSPTAIGLALCYAIGGIAAAFLSGSEEAFFFESAKNQGASFGPAYGRFISHQTIGMVVSGAVGGLIFSQIGSGSSVLLLSLSVTSMAVCALLVTSMTNRRSHSGPATEVARSSGSGMLTILKTSFRLIRQEQLLSTMAFVMMLIIGGEWFLYNIYPVLFAEAGVAPVWFGLSLSIGLSLNAVVTRHVHHLEKWFSLEEVIVGFNLLLALPYVVLMMNPSPTYDVIAVIALLALCDGNRPMISDYLNERIPASERVTILSGLSFAGRVASFTLRLLLTASVALGGVKLASGIHGLYLVIGAGLAFWLLVRCGCSHRVQKHTDALPLTCPALD